MGELAALHKLQVWRVEFENPAYEGFWVGAIDMDQAIEKARRVANGKRDIRLIEALDLKVVGVRLDQPEVWL